jgi:dipicolinate synthase subunit B
MLLTGTKVGFALTGSHCTLSRVLPELERLVAEGAEVTPIMSPAVALLDTSYGQAAQWRERVRAISCRDPLTTFQEVEPIGPRRLLDILVIAPCTGNTLAKLAGAVTDTPVLMAAKAQLRNGRPVVLSLSTNDGLGLNARNLGRLLAARNIYFVPFGQDNPQVKPNSLDADERLILPAIQAALEGRQLQPILVTRHRAPAAEV